MYKLMLTFVALAGLAIPLQAAPFFQQAPDVRPGGSYLGVGIMDIDAERAKALKLSQGHGVEVSRVETNSPAAKAGILIGDVLLEFNGQPLDGPQQLGRLVHDTPPGSKVKILAWRAGKTETVWAVVEARKSKPPEIVGMWPPPPGAMTPDMPGLYQADFAMEAAQIAKRVPKPVQLVWSREDDMTHDYYRPASYHRVSGVVDGGGNIVSWRHKSTSTSISEVWEKKAPPESSELGCFFQNPYITKNYRLEYLPAKSGVPRAWWRSVEASSIGFVMESYMDELAHAAGADPLEFRLKHLGEARKVPHATDKNEVPLDADRLRNVLEVSAQTAGWGTPLSAGRGRGIACHYSFHSYVSNVAEVSVVKGQLKLHRIVSVVDIGTAVNPDGIRAQVESAIIYGLTAALKSQITIKNGGAAEANFNKFTTLRMDETPAIEVYIMQSNLPPTGIGEPALPPTAPAVMNAVFAATGKRIRRLPLTPGDLT